MINAKTTDRVFTSAVGNEFYPADEGTQKIDVLLEYDGPSMNAVENVLAALVQNGQATQCDTVLLEQPDHQQFSRTFDTEAGANRIHLMFPAPETDTPVQILFSVNGTPYSMDYTVGEDASPARPIEKKGTDLVKGSHEITIDKVFYGKEVKSSVVNNKYEFFGADKDMTLLIVTYELKNLSENDLILSRDAGVYVIYDAEEETGVKEKYFAGQVVRRAGAGELNSSSPIAPEEQSKANYAFVEVPKDLVKRGGTAYLSVCDTLYSIAIP